MTFGPALSRCVATGASLPSSTGTTPLYTGPRETSKRGSPREGRNVRHTKPPRPTRKRGGARRSILVGKQDRGHGSVVLRDHPQFDVCSRPVPTEDALLPFGMAFVR